MSKAGHRSARLRPAFWRAATAIRSALVTWAAVLAVVAQVSAPASQQAMANTAESSAIAELSALLGQRVAFCDRASAANGSGAPAHDSNHWCGDCTLCQSASQPGVLDSSAPALMARLPEYIERSAGLSGAIDAKPRRAVLAQPRAPPAIV